MGFATSLSPFSSFPFELFPQFNPSLQMPSTGSRLPRGTKHSLQSWGASSCKPLSRSLSRDLCGPPCPSTSAGSSPPLSAPVERRACPHPELWHPKGWSQQVWHQRGEVPARSGRAAALQIPVTLGVSLLRRPEPLHLHPPWEHHKELSSLHLLPATIFGEEGPAFRSGDIAREIFF